MPTLVNLDGRCFSWAVPLLVCQMGSGLFLYVGAGWRGPFENLVALELAASE